MTTTAPFPWFGGKSLLATWIADMLPPHRTYVEPFGGSAAVLFTKGRSHMEVYNDLDQGCVTFFRVLRDQPDELVALLELTPHSRSEYLACRNDWTEAETDVERARRWYVSIAQSFGSSPANNKRGWNGEFLGASHTPAARAWAQNVSHLHAAARRFQGVQIESVDWREVLERYDHPEALFYVDPPYVLSTRLSGGYLHELSDVDHAELVDRLCRLSGMAIVSGYDHSIYAPLEEAGYVLHRRPAITRFGSSHGRGASPRMEMLWRRAPGSLF